MFNAQGEVAGRQKMTEPTYKLPAEFAKMLCTEAFLAFGGAEDILTIEERANQIALLEELARRTHSQVPGKDFKSMFDHLLDMREELQKEAGE